MKLCLLRWRLSTCYDSTDAGILPGVNNRYLMMETGVGVQVGEERLTTCYDSTDAGILPGVSNRYLMTETGAWVKLLTTQNKANQARVQGPTRPR